MQEPLHYLVKSRFLEGVPAKELRALASRCELRFVNAGELVVRVGAPADRIIFLAEGKLAVYRRNKQRGTALLLGILEGPSLFGDAEFSAGSPWMASARAEVDSCCIMIPGVDFMKMVERHAALAARLYRDASVRHLLAHHTAQTVALYDVETRLLRLLLDYAIRYGERKGNDAVVGRPISQVEIAAALAITRKTVSRILKPLEESGRVTRHAQTGHWTVHGVDELKKSLPKDLLGIASRLGELPSSVISQWTEMLYQDEGE